MSISIVEFLLSGFTDNSGNPLAGGKVFTYAAGTTTDKATYTDSLGLTPATNPVILDSNGRKQIYANGSYKFVVKTSADATLYTFDNLSFGSDAAAATFLGTTTGSTNTYVAAPSPAISSYVDGATFIFQAHQINTGAATLNISSLGAKSISGIAGQLTTGFTYLVRYKSSTDSFSIINPDPGYATTPAEMTALSTAGAEIVIRQAVTMTGNLTLAVPLRIEKGGSIVTTGYTLTVSGSFDAGLYQVFSGSGAVVFGKSIDEIRPEWFGALGDGTTDDTTAIQYAVNSANASQCATVRLSSKVYGVGSSVVPKDNVVIVGQSGRLSKFKALGTTTYSIFQLTTGTLDNFQLYRVGFDGSVNYPANSDTYQFDAGLKLNLGLYLACQATNISVKECYFFKLSAGGVRIIGENSADIELCDNDLNYGSYSGKALSVAAGGSSYTATTVPARIKITGNKINICGPQYHKDPSKPDYTASTDGIEVDATREVIIANNTVINTGGVGIRVEETFRASVTGNTVVSPGSIGIEFYNLSYDCTCVGNTIVNWGAIPFAYAMRDYGGTYVIAREFPDAVDAPLPADPTASTWFDTWPYSTTNITLGSVIAYSDTDYYTSGPLGILPFRGFSAIGVDGLSYDIAVSGNTCIGDTSSSGGGFTYANDFGFTIVHPTNSASNVGGENCTITGNVFKNCHIAEIYHPEYHDLINTNGLAPIAHYAANIAATANVQLPDLLLKPGMSVIQKNHQAGTGLLAVNAGSTGASTYAGLDMSIVDAQTVHSYLRVVRNGGTSPIQLNSNVGNKIEIGVNQENVLDIDSLYNVTLGRQVALATNATDGFAYIPTCAGTPTGAPTAKTGKVAMIVDTTNHRLYFYSGGSWRNAGP